MTFFDESKPNKYTELKKLLVPYNLRDLTYKRYGKRDGSYVLPKEWDIHAALSYGIGDDPAGVSFEQSLEEGGTKLHMYDGSIDEPPVLLEGEFFKEYLTEENFIPHCKKLFKSVNPFKKIVVKLDIEGHEYFVFNDDNLNFLKTFNAVCIEIHSLIEEVPEGWVLEPQLAQAKRDYAGRRSFLEALNRDFYLWHIHGNNHSPKYVDFPDSLELTYVNKRSSEKDGRAGKFPREGLDEANYDGRDDYVLDWWL